MKIALITDTHLAAIARDFVANCGAAIACINASGVDLVIHLGDVTADGIEVPDQLTEARTMLDALDPPLLYVPGNHDIGDNPVPGITSSHKPFDTAMLARFRAAFGPDRWMQHAAGWTLFGMNAQLFGTDDEEEHAQAAWLRDTLDGCSGPIGVFLHKPWFRETVEDAERHPRYVPLEIRRTLAAFFGPHDLRFVASGHTHQHRQRRVDGVDHVWVPSTAFVIPDAMQESIGVKRIGFAVLTLTPDHHRIEVVEAPGMRRHDLGDYADLFPKVGTALAKASR